MAMDVITPAFKTADPEQWTRLHQLWLEVEDQARNNDIYRSANSAILQQHQELSKQVVEDFRNNFLQECATYTSQLHPSGSDAIWASSEEALSVASSVRKRGDELLSHLRSMVGTSGAESAKDVVDNFESYAKSQADLSDLLTEVTASKVHKIGSSLDTISKIQLSDKSLQEKIDKYVEFVRSQLPENMGLVLGRAATRVNDAVINLFSGEFTKLTPDAFSKNLSMLRLAANAADATAEQACFKEILRLAIEDVQIVCNKVRSLPDATMFKMMIDANISPKFLGASLLLRPVSACFMNVRMFHDCHEPSFDTKCCAEQELTKKAVSLFTTNIAKQSSALERVKQSRNALHQALANGNIFARREESLQRAGDVDPESTLVTLALSYHGLEKFDLPIDTWCNDILAHVKANVDSAFNALIEDLNQIVAVMTAFAEQYKDGCPQPSVLTTFVKENPLIKNIANCIIALSSLHTFVQHTCDGTGLATDFIWRSLLME